MSRGGSLGRSILPRPTLRLVLAASGPFAVSLLALVLAAAAPGQAGPEAILPLLAIVALAADVLLLATALADLLAGSTSLKAGAGDARRLAIGATALPTEALSLGRATDLVWQLGNEADRRFRLQLLADLPPGLEVADGGGGILGLELGPKEASSAAFRVLATRRGPLRIPGLHARMTSPLGLFSLAFFLQAEAGLHVHPDLLELSRSRGLRRKGRTWRMGSRAARRRGEGGELEGLREYRVGEDARRIDWKASLRLGRPIAREYREDAGSHVAVAIDCGRLMAAEAGGQSILDRALAALVVLASTVLSSGDSLSCLAFADTVKGELPELRKGASLASLSAFAGGLEPAPVEADYRLAAFRLLSSLTKRSLVVILTDAAETMRLDSLEAAVTSLSRRHAVVVALLRDERAEAASAEAATDAPSAFRKAAASELVLARDLLAARLRRRAAVLFVRPHELTSTLLDAYAEAKERRRF